MHRRWRLFSSIGLSNVFMPKATLLRADVREAQVIHSDFRGLEAGVTHNAGWREDGYNAVYNGNKAVSGWDLKIMGEDEGCPHNKIWGCSF